MSDEIGNVKGISGTSMALNTQKGQGAVKSNPSGKCDPGMTKPERPAENVIGREVGTATPKCYPQRRSSDNHN